MSNETELREVEGISYKIVPTKEARDYVIQVCENEWDAEDFPTYGDDLYKSGWLLEIVDVSAIQPNRNLLSLESFQSDLKPRIEKQIRLHRDRTPIPPLILRGEDFLIFDGYARYSLFQKLGIKRCMAYVGHRKDSDPQA